MQESSAPILGPPQGGDGLDGSFDPSQPVPLDELTAALAQGVSPAVINSSENPDVVEQPLPGEEQPQFEAEYAAMPYDKRMIDDFFAQESSRLTAEDMVDLQQVLYKGIYHGEGIDPPGATARNAFKVCIGRQNFWRILVNDRAEAENLANDHIAGFHGTRSPALAGMLAEGYLGSGSHLRAQEAFVFTGEHIFQDATGQSGVSFTTIAGLDTALSYSGHHSSPKTLDDLRETVHKHRAWLEDYRSKGEAGPNFLATQEAIVQEREQAFAYIEANPTSLQAELTLADFPVVVTISRESLASLDNKDQTFGGRINRDGIVLGESSQAEFRVMTDRIEKSAIPLILVPSDRVQYVRELCDRYGFENTRIGSIEPYINALPAHLRSRHSPPSQ